MPRGKTDPIEHIRALAALGAMVVEAALDSGLVTKKVTKRRRVTRRRKAATKTEPKLKAKGAKRRGKSYPSNLGEAAPAA